MINYNQNYVAEPGYRGHGELTRFPGGPGGPFSPGGPGEPCNKTQSDNITRQKLIKMLSLVSFYLQTLLVRRPLLSLPWLHLDPECSKSIFFMYRVFNKTFYSASVKLDPE